MSFSDLYEESPEVTALESATIAKIIANLNNPGTQRNRLRAVCQIIVGSRDVTAQWDPHLIQLKITIKSGKMGECEFTLDDRKASLEIPPFQTTIKIGLGWSNETIVTAFTGYVWEVESRGLRSEGRSLIIYGRSTDLLSNVKTPYRLSMGEGAPPGSGIEGKGVTLGDMLKKFGSVAGLNVNIDPTLGALSRDYWHANESFMQFASRMAKEVGGQLTFTGNTANFTKLRPTLTNAQGDPVPVPGVAPGADIAAIWGDNLIHWSIRPFLTRTQYNATASSYYNVPKAFWETATQVLGGVAPFTSSKATNQIASAVANAGEAGMANSGAADAAMVHWGIGYVIINGEPNAMTESNIVVSGLRPGIDGTYQIWGIEHTYNRAQGFLTRVDIRDPKLGSYYMNELDRLREEALKNSPDGTLPPELQVPNKIEPGPAPESPWQYTPGAGGEGVPT